MKPYIKLIKNNWLPSSQCGWGNGYVVLPKGHKLHGKDYSEITNISVHGGLTYSQPDINGSWAIGFDTAHFGDTPEIWTIQAVEQEAINLLKQCNE